MYDTRSAQPSDDAMTAAFMQTFGYAPAGVWSAPGRVNLIGEHTDYNHGLCLPIALPRRAWLAASPRADDVFRCRSIDMDETVEVSISDVAPGHPAGWAAYQAGVLWAMRQAGLTVGGVDAVLRSDVPVGAGLSSSAAVEGCLAVAASDMFNLGLTSDDAGRSQLAELCQRAENDIAGAPTGGMDQAASLRAQPGKALLIDFASSDGPVVTLVPFDPGTDGLALLVMNTNAAHALVDGQYGARRQACHAAVDALGVTSLRQVAPDDLPDALARLDDDELRRATRHVVTETARVVHAVEAAKTRDWARFGALMDESHASMRDDYRISCPELDVACEVARQCGALGARMTGGGFGGSAIALIDASLASTVDDVLQTVFRNKGWTAPEVFAVEAGAAAG